MRAAQVHLASCRGRLPCRRCCVWSFPARLRHVASRSGVRRLRQAATAVQVRPMPVSADQDPADSADLGGWEFRRPYLDLCGPYGGRRSPFNVSAAAAAAAAAAATAAVVVAVTSVLYLGLYGAFHATSHQGPECSGRVPPSRRSKIRSAADASRRHVAPRSGVQRPRPAAADACHKHELPPS
jgi:hypothetical protein